nr:unnamed protein product [Digitaria exilis]
MAEAFSSRAMRPEGGVEARRMGSAGERFDGIDGVDGTEVPMGHGGNTQRERKRKRRGTRSICGPAMRTGGAAKTYGVIDEVPVNLERVGPAMDPAANLCHAVTAYPSPSFMPFLMANALPQTSTHHLVSPSLTADGYEAPPLLKMSCSRRSSLHIPSLFFPGLCHGHGGRLRP